MRLICLFLIFSLNMCATELADMGQSSGALTISSGPRERIESTVQSIADRFRENLRERLLRPQLLERYVSPDDDTLSFCYEDFNVVENRNVSGHQFINSFVTWLNRLKELLRDDWKIFLSIPDSEDNPPKIERVADDYVIGQLQSLYSFSTLQILIKTNDGEDTQLKSLLWHVRRVAPIEAPVLEHSEIKQLAQRIFVAEKNPISFITALDAAHYVSVSVTNSFPKQPSKFDLPGRYAGPMPLLGKTLSLLHSIALSDYIFFQLLSLQPLLATALAVTTVPILSSVTESGICSDLIASKANLSYILKYKLNTCGFILHLPLLITPFALSAIPIVAWYVLHNIGSFAIPKSKIDILISAPQLFLIASMTIPTFLQYTRLVTKNILRMPAIFCRNAEDKRKKFLRKLYYLQKNFSTHKEELLPLLTQYDPTNEERIPSIAILSKILKIGGDNGSSSPLSSRWWMKMIFSSAALPAELMTNFYAIAILVDIVSSLFSGQFFDFNSYYNLAYIALPAFISTFLSAPSYGDSLLSSLGNIKSADSLVKKLPGFQKIILLYTPILMSLPDVVPSVLVAFAASNAFNIPYLSYSSIFSRV